MSAADSAIGRDAPGRFYVDACCIGCMVCIEIAPQIFSRQRDEEIVFVARQPVGHHEIAQCVEAVEICPVEAIGEQGEKVLQRRIGSELK